MKKKRPESLFRLDGWTRLHVKWEGRELVMQIEVLPEKVANRWQVIMNYSKFWETSPGGSLVSVPSESINLGQLKIALNQALEDDGFTIVNP